MGEDDEEGRRMGTTEERVKGWELKSRRNFEDFESERRRRKKS